jgi:2',3'-cyclic-nucleotide 2'-phosphodiesterase (5'-nucleotidase family)
LDAGGFSENYSVDGILKTRKILEAYKLMGVNVLNITDREMTSMETKDEIKDIKRNHKYDILECGITAISANIINEETNKPFFNTYVKFNVKGNSIGITGLTDFATKKWKIFDCKTLITKDPIEAAKPVVEKLSKEVNLVILLADMPFWKIEETARALPEINIILATDGHTTLQEIRKCDNTYISYCGAKGQNLGILDLVLNENGEISDLKHSMIRLEPTMPEDKKIKAIVDSAKEKILNTNY